jgi:hypothetical protein
VPVPDAVEGAEAGSADPTVTGVATLLRVLRPGDVDWSPGQRRQFARLLTRFGADLQRS